MPVRIVQTYELAWNETKGGSYRVKFQGSAQWEKWNQVTPADLAAIAAVLKEGPCYFDTDTNTFATGPEIPDA
jgi:hypothetical protein